jgi:hypothetical protein
MTNEGVSKYPNTSSWINYLFYLLIEFPFTLIPPDIRPKAASHLAVSSVSVQHSAPRVAAGLVNV